MYDNTEESIVSHLSFTSVRLNQTFSSYIDKNVWSPAINMYQTSENLELCMDLAGVDRSALDIQIKPGQLKISGYRKAPHPPAPAALADDNEVNTNKVSEPMRIVCMEIDYGSFTRTVTIPKNINLDKVESVYRQGMLWIVMPLI